MRAGIGGVLAANLMREGAGDTARLLLSPDDELLAPQFLLLSGDMTDGDDRVILSGDMQ